MEDHGNDALRRLLDELPGALRSTHAQVGDATALVQRERVTDVLRFLRDADGLEFDMLTDLCAVDYLGHPAREAGDAPRFEVVYHLYSLRRNRRVRVKAGVPEEPCELPSAHELYASANWMEREVFDLYGIRFTGHPDLRRILLYEEFEGHPLRKDYPTERRQPLVGPRN